jgi:hypothetical protein
VRWVAQCARIRRTPDILSSSVRRYRSPSSASAPRKSRVRIGHESNRGYGALGEALGAGGILAGDSTHASYASVLMNDF